MHVLFLLVERLLPLYALILIGYIAGRLLDLHRETVARLVIYVVMPVVVLYAVATTPLSVGNLSLPVVYFLLGSGLSFAVYGLTRRLWGDSTANVLAFTSGTANTGYFGIPVALAVFGPWSTGLVIFANLGLVLFENGIGFYHVARGQYSLPQALRKFAGLPALYAFALGIILNIAHLPIPPPVANLAEMFRDAYSLLGMMIIGLGLSGMRRLAFDGKFTGIALLVKFAIWPLAISGLLWADHLWVHLLTPQAALIMAFMSFMPLAANTVVFATELRAQPEKAALAVVISTVVALVIVPLAAGWLTG